MAGRLEIMELALEYVKPKDFKAQLAILRSDPDKREKMAHSAALIKKALEDGESFDHRAVRPDNCYIICVAVI